jgi:hypothetical protein
VLPTLTAVAFVAIGGVGLGHAVANGQAPHAAIGAIGAPATVPQVLISPVSSPASTPSVAPSRKSAHKTARHPVTPAALVVTDTGSACYLQVTTKHGRLIVRRILHGHQQMVFRKHGLDVVLGNAGAVRIAVNGHHTRRAGGSGQVLRFRVR